MSTHIGVNLTGTFASPLTLNSSFNRYFIPNIYVVTPVQTFGILINSLVIYLTFGAPNIQGTYRIFIANLALADILFCLCFIGANVLACVHYFFEIEYSLKMCTVEIGLPLYSGASMLCALPWISYNRYKVVVRNEGDFSNRKALLLCLCGYWPYLQVFAIGFAQYFPGYTLAVRRCGFVHRALGSMESLQISLVGSYFLIVYSTVSLYKYLSANYRNANSLLRKQKSQAEIKDEWLMLLALTILSLIPILTSLPSFVSIVLDPEMEYLTLGHIALFCVSLNPIFDAITTLFVLRQYKIALTKLLKGKLREEAGEIRSRRPTVRRLTHRVSH